MPTSRRSSIERLPALAAIHAEMRLQRLADLEADGEAGIEAGDRLLEDHRHVLADHLPAPARREREKVLAREGEPVGGDGRGLRQEPMTASIATDLPEPDSPTIATTSPASTSRSMPSTALNGPAAVAKVTERLRISRRGIGSSATLSLSFA